MVLVEKQPEPTETGQDGGAPRKKAYNQRRKYHKDTIAMDRQQKRAYNANKRAKWSDAMKTAWKESWKSKTATWKRREVRQEHLHQSLPIRKKEPWLK